MNQFSGYSCWIVTEDLPGLQNQAVGVAEALGVDYAFKEIYKPLGLWRLMPERDVFGSPWPDLLITCGRRSVGASLAVSRASGGRTFTIHIQDPGIDPRHFDVVIVQAQDKLAGENVFVTQGAVHHINKDKLCAAKENFSQLFASLPRPLIGVLVGGRRWHQKFSVKSANDLAQKISFAAIKKHGSLAVMPSRRTGRKNINILTERLKDASAYVWDGKGKDPYLGVLALSDYLIVTSDSKSMISEACSTGKPVYVYELLKLGRRHKSFLKSFKERGMIRHFSGVFENWTYVSPDETRLAADFILRRFAEKKDVVYETHEPVEEGVQSLA